MWSLHEIMHICTVDIDESEDWSSQQISNLSHWKEEAWKKNQGFIGIRTRGLPDTGAMLYQLSYEATHWERGHSIDLAPNVWLHIIIVLLYIVLWKIKNYCGKCK